MGKKILLIDDSDILLSVQKLLLEEAGFAVRTAHSLSQFDAALEGWAPDLVLTDVNMPDVTGPELCRHIRAQLAARSVPLVPPSMDSGGSAKSGCSCQLPLLLGS